MFENENPERVALGKSLIHNERLSALSRVSRLSVHSFYTGLYYIKENWRSGMQVAFINIAGNLNAAYKSGVAPAIGVSTSFLGALVNGFFSGSNHSIYVPSAWTTGYALQVTRQYGPEAIGVITIFVGLQLFVIRLLKIHQLVYFLPLYVSEGSFLGLVFVIMHYNLDYFFQMKVEHDLSISYDSYCSLYEDILMRGNYTHMFVSVAIGLLLVKLHIYNRDNNKRYPWVIFTTLSGILLSMCFSFTTLHDIFGEITVHSIQLVKLKDHVDIVELFQWSFTFTFIILVQNLVTVRVAECMLNTNCDFDQEMLCVSVANIVSGIFSGIPVCSSTRMVILNNKIRNMNRWSSIINAFTILLLYLIFPNYLQKLPQFIIAAHYFYICYQCPDWNYCYKVFGNKSRRYLLYRYLTIAWICFYFGFIHSIVIGSLYGLLMFANYVKYGQSEVICNDQTKICLDENPINCLDDQENAIYQIKVYKTDFPFKSIENYLHYRFNGFVNFINIKSHLQCIKAKVGEKENIIFSFEFIHSIDEEAVDKFSDMCKQLIDQQRKIFFTGLRMSCISELAKNQFFMTLITEQPFLFYGMNCIKKN